MEISKLQKAGSGKSAEIHQGQKPLFYSLHFFAAAKNKSRAITEANINIGMKTEFENMSSKAMKASWKMIDSAISAMPVPLRNPEISGLSNANLCFFIIAIAAVSSNAVSAIYMMQSMLSPYKMIIVSSPIIHFVNEPRI